MISSSSHPFPHSPTSNDPLNKYSLMTVIHWSALWFRLMGLFCYSGSQRVDREILLPATSSRRASDVALLHTLPTVKKCPKRISELEGLQHKPKNSVALRVSNIPVHERRSTPLFTFHSNSNPRLGGDEGLNAAVGVDSQREREDDPSLTSLPPLSLVTPLSTSNRFRTASPFVDRRNSSSVPAESGHFNLSRVGNSQSAGVTDQPHVLLDFTTSSPLPRDIAVKSSRAYAGRRRFCACRDPCSNCGLASSTQRTSASGCSKFKDTFSSNSLGNPAGKLTKRHSFVTGRFTDLPAGVRHGRSVDSYLVNSLNLMIPDSTRRRDLCSLKPWEPPAPVFTPYVGNTVAESQISRQRSETYDAWVSSWCFRPTATPTQDTARLCYIVPPPSKSRLSLLSCKPPSGPLPVRVSGTELDLVGSPALGGLGILLPSSGMAVRKSCVQSGMNSLENLQELLAVLDEAMIKSGTPRESLDRRDVSLPQRPVSEAVIMGLAV